MTLALAGIREDYRQAFVLFHENELSYVEIAEAMSVPLGTVKSRIRLGLDKLGCAMRSATLAGVEC